MTVMIAAAYWPVTPLSAVVAVLTDTDHPLSSGQNTFIILLTFFSPSLSTFFYFPPQHLSLPGKGKSIYTRRANNNVVPTLRGRDVIDLQDGQNVMISKSIWFILRG